MSSLWTPEGEHRVEPRTSPEPASGRSAVPPEPSAAPAGGGEPPTAEDAELQQEFEQLERELLEAPVEDVIANHCYGLFQLAALHLGQRPPNLDKARLSIDALGAIVEALGGRLGTHTESFTDGLAQLRLAYVQLHGDPPPAAGSPLDEATPPA